jgi:outer membrane protein OmpA-like peptidoglycan-associated protein
MRSTSLSLALSFAVTAAASAALATTAPAPASPPAAAPSPPAKQPDSLVLHFDSGKATIRPKDEALLDKRSRLYRDGQSIVMVVSDATDAVGSANQNLPRANAVIRGLEARGIPAERLQLLAKGESEPAVQAQVAEPRNRRVEITWR